MFFTTMFVPVISELCSAVSSLPRLCEIKAIQVHDFGPGCHKVMDELLLPIRTAVNFSQGPKLGV